MRAISIAGVTAICAAVSGCAAPTFRNVVYENVSTSARVLDPKGHLWARNTFQYKTNSYRYVPGSIVTAQSSEAANPIFRSAGLLGKFEVECFQAIYTIDKTGPIKPTLPPVHTSYDFEVLFDLPFAKSFALNSFKESHHLDAIP